MKITIEIEEKELSALIDNQKRTKKEKFNEFAKYFSDELKKTIKYHAQPEP